MYWSIWNSGAFNILLGVSMKMDEVVGVMFTEAPVNYQLELVKKKVKAMYDINIKPLVKDLLIACGYEDVGEIPSEVWAVLEKYKTKMLDDRLAFEGSVAKEKDPFAF